MPPIYAFDSTNEDDWEKNVRLPSSEVIASFLQVFSTVCHEISIFSLIIFPQRGRVIGGLGGASGCNFSSAATTIPPYRWAFTHSKLLNPLVIRQFLTLAVAI